MKQCLFKVYDGSVAPELFVESCKRMPPLKRTRLASTFKRPPLPRKPSSSEPDAHIPDQKHSMHDIVKIQETLKEFDLEVRYGPCVGITRTSRWQRAIRLQLDPPEDVIVVLSNGMLKKKIPDLDFNLWHGELG